MKGKAILSAVLGFFFGMIGFFVLLFLNMDGAGLLAVLAGLLFAALLFPTLIIYEKVTSKRYAEMEQKITSPIFYKANGNFNLGMGKIKNGNIYFCEDGIVCVCMEEKPYTLDEILLRDIDRFQFDNIHLKICTKDGRTFVITLPNVKKVMEVLKEKSWI